MQDFAKTAAVMVIGGVVGVGGFALVTQEKDAEAAPAPIELPVVDEVPQAPAQPAAEAEPASEIEVQAMVTGGIERNRPGAAFVVFDVTSGDDVSDVELVVTGAAGTRPQEAIGANFHTSGDRMTIELGELGGQGSRQVVVALNLAHDSGDFSYHTTHQSLHGERETVRSTAIDRGVSRKQLNQDAYKIVRQHYNEDTLALARGLRDEGKYEDALEWVQNAHQANVEVGMSVRLTGELAGYQKELRDLQTELEELMKPKPKVRKKPTPQAMIEVCRLDKGKCR